MGNEHGGDHNLVEHIEDSYARTDVEARTDLRNCDHRYADMWDEAAGLLKAYPAIVELTRGDGPIYLSAAEHRAFARYIDLKRGMSDMERKEIFFRGHMSNFAYLVRTTGIHID